MTLTKILRRVGVAVGSMALLSLGASAAFGQESADGLDTPSVEKDYRAGAGFRITEEIIFHPRLELQGGYQSNVFYEDDSEGPVGSPLMRIGVGAVLTTQEQGTNEAGQVAPKVALNGDVALTWNQYIVDNDSASGQSNLGIHALVGMQVNPQGSVTFELRDGFTRAVNPPPVETPEDIPRDKNELLAGIIVKPGGGALSIYGNLTWTLDRFENAALSFADRNSFIGAIGTRWQWLPKTQLNAEVSFGVVLTDSFVKHGDSTPLRITVGTSTLITPKFGTVLRIGYGNAFYSEGASYNSFLALAELRYALAPTFRLAAGYSRDFTDSLIGNYRSDDSLFARFAAQFGGRVQLGAKASVIFRTYDGLLEMGAIEFCEGDPAVCGQTSRDDLIFSLGTDLDFQANEWLVVGASYYLISDTTDTLTRAAGTGMFDSVGFVWQEFMVKATAKF